MGSGSENEGADDKQDLNDELPPLEEIPVEERFENIPFIETRQEVVEEETKLDVKANLYNYSDGSGDEETNTTSRNDKSHIMHYNDLEELD